MENLRSALGFVVREGSLRGRILFVLFGLALFRLLSSVPIPAADGANLARFLENNQAFGFLNILTGSGLSAVSLVMLGVGPYITASIIMQLSTIMSAKMKTLYHEEGEAGRKKFAQYSRLLTVPLAVLQGYGLLAFLGSQGALPVMSGFDLFVSVTIVTAGSVLLMWLGELMSEFGIGNGMSLIIFGGIVAGLPAIASQLAFTFTIAKLPVYIGFFAAALLVIAAVVTVTEAERPIPITYAKKIRGMKVYGGTSTYLPLRINQAGVIPIIFALSILIFPQVIASFLSGIDNASVAAAAAFIQGIITNVWFSSLLYFGLVFLFTYFYTAVTFDPENVATNLQKGGAFIPGIRPGRPTAEYLAKVVTRITLVGATFLGAIAVLPLIMQSVTNVQAFAIGGTALLIVVSVVVDLVKKIGAQVAMREY